MTRPSRSCSVMPDAKRDAQRPPLREDRRAGISLAFGDVPERLVIGEQQRLEHVRRAARFLETENIGLLGFDEGKKILPQHRTQAVDVPGDRVSCRRRLRHTRLPAIAAGVKAHVAGGQNPPPTNRRSDMPGPGSPQPEPQLAHHPRAETRLELFHDLGPLQTRSISKCIVGWSTRT